MFDYCYGKPTKGTVADFLSKTTGKHWEDCYTKVSMPSLCKPWSASDTKLASMDYAFNYHSLIGKHNGSPSKHQVIDFMVKECGYHYESALDKLNNQASSEGVKYIGAGQYLYPI